jgi:transcriptional regulator with XRE-family HTH domain
MMSSHKSMDLGKAIKILLERRGLTQKDLALKTELSEASISKMLKGKTQPRKENLEQIASVLGVKPEILMILSICRDDVPDDRKIVYDMVWPQLEATLVNLFSK